MELPEPELLNEPVPPLNILHAPVPTPGVLPPSEELVRPQTLCAAPTEAIDGAGE